MYIIQEIQTTNGTCAFLPIEQRADRNEAESVFHSKCSFAAVSSVPVHTVITYTEEGFPIPELTKCYKHDVPAPEPEPEAEE